MSGILWKEMLAQGMVRSRGEAARLVKQGGVRYEILGRSYVADFDDLDLPGTTVVRVGKHMFRLASRLQGEGWDQLRGRIEIPVTAPEGPDGGIHVPLADIVCTAEEIAELSRSKVDAGKPEK